jgi:putative periplasmic solute-binding protein
MLRIGFVDYINAFPLNAAFRLNKLPTLYSFTYATPNDLNARLRSKELDLSMISSVEYFQGQYALLPGYGIFANDKIMSVNLYQKTQSLNGVTIGLTNQSFASAELLKVLCAFFWNVSPKFEVIPQDTRMDCYEAFLLIGDEALKKRMISGYQTIDLARSWYQATGLPFVFSVFAMQKNHTEKKAAAISDFKQKLQAALNWSENEEEHIISLAAQRTSLPQKTIKEYYSACRYRIGEREMHGLETFFELHQKLERL